MGGRRGEPKLMFGDALSRKDFLVGLLATGAATALPVKGLAQGGGAAGGAQPSDITAEDLKVLEKVFAIEFSDEERNQVLRSVQGQRRGYEAMRELPITYQIEPPTVFRPSAEPDMPGRPEAAVKAEAERLSSVPQDDLSFLSISQLGHLLRTKQVSPVELTEHFLKRLEQYGEKLLCLVTLTPELAREQAKRAEQELMSGVDRGPLHGIPYGIKDLFATRGIPTTWGADPYATQVFDYDAGVVERLRDAGAILVAKLSLGALAQGDVWFKGRTKNPWNPERGSSGSSAGSASATAAGLVPFAIGTETLGSIMSPSHECRVTGLRPTYGRVTRHGAMAVSWTMDKAGPICRSADDCALVFAAICGHDPRDRSTVAMPFQYDRKVDWTNLKIAYLIGNDDDPADRSRLESDDYLKTLVGLGAKLQPIKVSASAGPVMTILGVEAAAAFDEFTRTELIDQLKNSSWPITYRSNRYVPAVEFLQAQRARELLIRQFWEQTKDVDMIVANERGGALLSITNLTGHPQILIPNGATERNTSRSWTIVGKLYDEAAILAVANAHQRATGIFLKHPDLSKL